MAEPKRHRDVPQGAFFGRGFLIDSSTESKMSEALRKLLREGQKPQQPVITPHVGVLTLHFQLYGCDDLKAKRKVFTALKAVWGKEPDLARRLSTAPPGPSRPWAPPHSRLPSVWTRSKKPSKNAWMLPYWIYTGKYSDRITPRAACGVTCRQAVYYAPSGMPVRLPAAGDQTLMPDSNAGRIRRASGTGPSDDH
mgnify:CR=1 FL=1